MVPTFTCGLVRSNFTFAIASPQSTSGAPIPAVLSNTDKSSETSREALDQPAQSAPDKTRESEPGLIRPAPDKAAGPACQICAAADQPAQEASAPELLRTAGCGHQRLAAS